MDWSKLKMNELKYYCTSFDIDFDCLPVSDQIRYLIGAFYHYGITAFEIADIKEFLRKPNITLPE